MTYKGQSTIEKREQIAVLLAKGLTMMQIADQLSTELHKCLVIRWIPLITASAFMVSFSIVS
jgi:hypothetical protein